MKVPDETTLADAATEALAPAPALAAAFRQLLRNEPSEFAAHLSVVEADVEIANTRTRAHCHVISLDLQGNARMSLLVDHLVSHVVDYAIPRSRIREAAEYQSKTGSARKYVKLMNEARALFTDMINSGEGGELLLYVLAESVLQIPQLICKMSLKTSAKMHYHGADGVHGHFEPTSGILTLFWGESKVHANPKSAMEACLEDLKPFLISEDGSGTPRNRDLHLLSEHADLNDPAIEHAIRLYLDPDSVLSKRVRHSGVALASFNFDGYGNLKGEHAEAALQKSAVAAAQAWWAYLKDRGAHYALNNSDIQFFCVPMPDVDGFRTTFRERLGIS